jgi:tetratricopeptide (TPR) repeat protein/predicted aspartyl protease
VKPSLIVSVLVALALTVVAPPAVAKCILQKLADLPVTMVGLRPMISAKINDVDVRLFIDSGSFANTLNPDAAARIGLRTSALPPEFEVRGLTGEAEMRMATAKDFSILGVHIHQAEFLVGEHDLGGGDGLIGQQILDKFDVEYDLANGMVRLFAPKDCGTTANLGYWKPGQASFITILGIGQMSGDIVGPASINGQKIHVLFDTGTPRSALTTAAARRAGVRAGGPDVVSDGSVGGVGRKMIESCVAPFASFGIDDELVKNARLRVADFQMDEAEMLLGTDFFLSHHIYVARSQNRLYFTYNGGPVFNLEQADTPTPALAGQAQAAAAPSGAPPAASETAEDFARRAAAEFARHEYDLAIADDGRAIALAPSDARHFYDRGRAHWFADQSDRAMDDFNAALKLDPGDVDALMARGRLRLDGKAVTGAGADFDAAMKADPRVAEDVGEAYADAGLYAAAVSDFDRWIAAHRRDEDLADALGARCQARLMLGQQLDQALADCSLAIRYQPGDSEVLTSRGLLELRLGKFDPALADLGAVVRAQPKSAWALYGRGVAERHKGLKAQGDADIAAASAITPDIAADAAKIGVTP